MARAISGYPAESDDSFQWDRWYIDMLYPHPIPKNGRNERIVWLQLIQTFIHHEVLPTSKGGSKNLEQPVRKSWLIAGGAPGRASSFLRETMALELEDILNELMYMYIYLPIYSSLAFYTQTKDGITRMESGKWFSLWIFSFVVTNQLGPLGVVHLLQQNQPEPSRTALSPIILSIWSSIGHVCSVWICLS